ncbi:MAG: glycosyltransferase [Balneolaceae bacterium]|nr:glycosyltransferase [Balneolaceae bacterium]
MLYMTTGPGFPATGQHFSISGKYDIPLIVTPHGLLKSGAMRQNTIKKRLAWNLYQKTILKEADLVHVTSEDEKEDLLRLGIKTEITVIPNGVNIPDCLSREDSGGLRKALFLSRMEPIKGLPMLLKAWNSLNTSGWELILAGPSKGSYIDSIRNLISKLQLENVKLNGEIAENDKWDLYCDSDLFILPSHSENFALVVAEALATGLPVITTTSTPWEELRSHRCGWWVAPELDHIRTALEEALNLSRMELKHMGKRGRDLIERNYTWENVSARMETLYRKVCS